MAGSAASELRVVTTIPQHGVRNLVDTSVLGKYGSPHLRDGASRTQQQRMVGHGRAVRTRTSAKCAVRCSALTLIDAFG